MKKISLIITFLVLVSLAGAVLVQGQTLPAKEPLPVLPNPGLIPGDFFYFLDEWTEAIQEFFTFNPEAKALLQTERALERIAEVKTILEARGVEAPGLDVALEKIQTNIARANQIIEAQKARGREVAQLVKKLDSDFDASQELLEQTLEVEEAKLKAQKKEIKLQILQARQAGNFDRVDELRTALAVIGDQKDKVEQKWRAKKERLGIEEEKLEADLEVAEREREKLEELEKGLLEQKEEELKRIFEQREKDLELRERGLEIDLRKAILEGNIVLAQQIQSQLLDLENQEKTLERERRAAETGLEEKRERLEMPRDLRERAEEQIKEAEKEVADVKKEIAELIAVPEAIAALVREAESKLATAIVALEAGNYGRAYGQAMAAEMLARNVGRKIEREEELKERIEEIEKRIEGEIKEKEKIETRMKEIQREMEMALPAEKAELEDKLREAESKREEKRREVEEIRELREKVEIRDLRKLEELEKGKIEQ